MPTDPLTDPLTRLRCSNWGWEVRQPEHGGPTSRVRRGFDEERDARKWLLRTLRINFGPRWQNPKRWVEALWPSKPSPPHTDEGWREYRAQQRRVEWYRQSGEWPPWECYL
jgi:hypothetical protein